MRLAGLTAAVLLVFGALRLLGRGRRISTLWRAATTATAAGRKRATVALPWPPPRNGPAENAISAPPLALPNAVLNAEVTDGRDTIFVRLTGAGAQTRRPYTWVAAKDSRPQAPGTVALGARDDSTLYVDFLLSPDIVTVTGPEARRRRLVHALARQLNQSGAAVTVVGDAAGHTPEGAAAVSSYEQVAGHTVRSPLMVVSGAITGAQGIPAIRHLTRMRPRTVLVIVGETRRARWSLHVESDSGEVGRRHSTPDLPAPSRL